MRAAVTEGFGGIDLIVVRDLPTPTPGPGEVLVRVKAAAMNPLDCKLREGTFRLIFRVKRPFVLGFDVAGEVEAVGPGVRRLRVGDVVFGALSRPGAHAEYDVFPLDAIRDAHVRMQSGHARGKIVVRP
jgi:NADPH2:quinone reductase